MAKHTIQISDDKLYEGIVEYCSINGLKIGEFCSQMLKKQFAIEKYGDFPFGVINGTKPNIEEHTVHVENPPKQIEVVEIKQEEIQPKEDLPIENKIEEPVKKTTKRRL